MTVLHHALCGDDFHQTLVSIILREKCSKFFVGFVGDATQVNPKHTCSISNFSIERPGKKKVNFQGSRRHF